MKRILTSIFLVSALLLSSTMIHAEEASTPEAISITNPDISADMLHLKVRHLSADELFVEADAWLVLLKEAAKKVYDVKFAIKEENNKVTELSEKGDDLIEQVEESKKAQNIEQNTSETEEKKEIEKESNSSTDENTSIINKLIPLSFDKSKSLEHNASASKEHKEIEEEIKSASEEKVNLLEQLTEARSERKGMVDRLDTILKNINDKIGTGLNGQEADKVLPYRRYIDTVKGISLEVTDAHTAWSGISEWVVSEEGGLYWLMNILKFLSIITFAWFISKLLSRGARKALELSPSNSQLLNDFIANIIHKIVMMIGLLVALAALDVNVGPIMAIVGAAGFVVAFALQGTLSNFASGIMVMLYRPYDIGDLVDVAGIMGTVESMTLVSTSIVTADNRQMIVPNNSIWGNIITNVTHSDKRRIDLTFGIGYEDDMAKAQKVMEEILAEHPLVLKTPEPNIKVHELADSSVNFICRPWVKTADYWTVYWEVTRSVKERFDEEQISIPYPQMDVHTDSAKA